MIKAVSLFSSAGIGELCLPKNIKVVVANELLPQRADCYCFLHPQTKMFCGDICDASIRKNIIKYAKENKCDLLIATPPCQGLSTLGKNKVQEDYLDDKRNFLVLETFEIIEKCDFSYVIYENVPKFIDMYFPYQGDYKKLGDILYDRYGAKYNIEVRILNAKDYGVPQSRPRSIIKMWKKGLKWGKPDKQKEITLFTAIGHLPSLEPGEDSGIKWHKAKEENPRIVLAMRHTMPGKSALNNEVYYPKKSDGSRIRGFHNTFTRMVWDKPCPARTTYSGSMSSHNNVHPGRLNSDGTYSDPRVLTLLETFIVSTVPVNIEFPVNTTDNFIRTVIGEAVPPKMLCEVLRKIGRR